MATRRRPAERVLATPTMDAIARVLADGRAKRVVVLSGAGVSTAAGIPDFRSPETGLYANLRRFALPFPEAIFNIRYFHKQPEPFFALAKELYPGLFLPTLTHYFVRLLAEKNLLLRNFTQNIDTLELVAGVPSNLVVEAHGSFSNAHCVGWKVDDPDLSFSSSSSSDSDSDSDSNTTTNSKDSHKENSKGSALESISALERPKEHIVGCGREYDSEWVKEEVFQGRVPRCTHCGGLVKPDIVFFGEDLPPRFYKLSAKDLRECDLLIVIGTSLKVHPFAGLISQVRADVPRLLINRDLVGEANNGFGQGGFDFEATESRFARDAVYLGDCDKGCLLLAKLLGWGDELVSLYKTDRERLRIKFGLSEEAIGNLDWHAAGKELLRKIDRDVALAFKHIDEEKQALEKEEQSLIDAVSKLEINKGESKSKTDSSSQKSPKI